MKSAASNSWSRSNNRALYHDSFFVFSEHLPQSVADLAHGRVAFDRMDDGGHQVLAGTGGLFDGFEPKLPRGCVAPHAQGAHALDLLAFEVRIDPQNVDRLLLVDLKAIHADHNLLQAVHILLE